MKTAILTIFLSAALASFASAATPVSYTATDDPNLNPDGNATPGGAADVWTVTFTSGDNGLNGSFLGDSGSNGGAGSGSAGAGTSAWALYANTGNTATATHFFDGGPLSIGQTVSLQLDTGFLEAESDAGLRLLGSGGDFRFALSFIGGDSDYRYYDDGSGSVAVHSFTDAGFTFSFTLTGATTYSASVTGGSSWTGTISGDIGQIQFYNNHTGPETADNVFANNLSVTAVPEPGSIALFAVGGIASLIALRRRAARA